jgi:hypothetical protein
LIVAVEWAATKCLVTRSFKEYVDSVRSARLLERIVGGDVSNVRFTDLLRLARELGFEEVEAIESSAILNSARS